MASSPASASVSVRRLLVALAVPAAFLLGGCGAGGAPAVVGPTVVVPATGTAVVVSTSVATTVAPAPVATTPVVVPAPAPAPVVVAPAPAAPADCGGDYYVNSDGNCVHRPEQAPSAPAGATARCVDGTYSFSQHRSGTCSHHGGVAEWLA